MIPEWLDGAGVWGFSVLAVPLGEELGWSRALVYGALTVRSLSSGTLAPFTGPHHSSIRRLVSTGHGAALWMTCVSDDMS